MRWRDLGAAVLAVVVLGGCGGGGGGARGGASTTAAAITSTQVVGGRIDGPCDGALVFLVAPDPSATSLAALADTIVDSTEVGPGGAFEVALEAGQRASEVLVSAPGRAITRAALGAPIALAPEARVDVGVTDPDGRAEPLALALVLDPQGRPLPVQADEACAGDAGRLSVGRLPAGTWELLVGSGDGERHGRATVVVAAGERTRVDVVVDQDPDLARRFAVAAGVDTPLLDAPGGAR